MPIISKSIVFVYKQMLISTISYNAIPFTTIFSQFFTFLLLSSHLFHATVCIIKSFLCHDIKQAMSYRIMEFYVTTIAASLIHECLSCIIMVWAHKTKLGLDKQVIIYILNIFKYFDECVDIFQLCTMSIAYVTINELTHLHA